MNLWNHLIRKLFIGLHVNAHKTEHLCFNQTGDITTLNGSSLKLDEKFTYRGSSVSSTDINTRLAKAWTAIDRQSVMWKSDLTDKRKRSFFQAAVMSILLYGCTRWTLTKRMQKNTWQQLHKNAATNIKLLLEPSPDKASALRPPTTHHEKSQNQTNQTRRNRDELMTVLLLWTPSHGRVKSGWPARTYIHQPWADTGCSSEDLPAVMVDMVG